MKLNGQEIVTKMLTLFPKCRDNDELLIWRIWKRDMKKMGYDINKMKGKKIGEMFISWKLTKQTSIIRHRQKLQEEIPKYRGYRYNIRNNKDEPEVREQIINYKIDVAIK